MPEVTLDLRKLLDIVTAKLNQANLDAAIWQARCVSLQEELDKLPKASTKQGEGVG